MKIKFKQSNKRKPKPWFTPVKLNTKKSVKFINTKHLTWPQATIKYPNLKAYGDADKDGVFNGWDCKPFNSKKQGPHHKKMTLKEAKRDIDLFRKQKGESAVDAYRRQRIGESYHDYNYEQAKEDEAIRRTIESLPRFVPAPSEHPWNPALKVAGIPNAIANERVKQKKLRMEIAELQAKVDQEDQLGWDDGEGSSKASKNISKITKDSRRMKKLESSSKEQSAQSLIDDILKD